MQSYSFVRGRPWGLVVGFFGVLITVESTAVHLMLAPHVRWLAWLLTVTSIYALVWLVRDYLALRAGGLELRPDGLALRFGLRWQVHVPWAAVEDARVGGVAVDLRGGRDTDLLVCRVLRTDVQLALREPIVAHGPYGLRRPFRRLALAVDAPERFVADVKQRIRRPADGAEQLRLARPTPGL